MHLGEPVYQPATIKLFLVDGLPNGLRTAEISNWSGKAVAAPRSSLKSLIQRPELDSAGIYFLSGVDPLTNQNQLYIGEAESVRRRIPQHTDKDFWVSATAFISKDRSLTKAHIKYLEERLLTQAKERHIKLANTAIGQTRLPEPDAAEMNVFYDKILQLLPVLGVDTLKKLTQSKQAPRNALLCKIKNLVAKGNRSENGFTIYAGSEAALEDRASATWSKGFRAELLQNGILKAKNDRLIFTEDIEFSSPSAAAAVVRGGNANGLTKWRNEQGQTLKELES